MPKSFRLTYIVQYIHSKFVNPSIVDNATMDRRLTSIPLPPGDDNWRQIMNILVFNVFDHLGLLSFISLSMHADKSYYHYMIKQNQTQDLVIWPN